MIKTYLDGLLKLFPENKNKLFESLLNMLDDTKKSTEIENAKQLIRDYMLVPYDNSRVIYYNKVKDAEQILSGNLSLFDRDVDVDKQTIIKAC